MDFEERRYLADPYTLDFTATVTAVEASDGDRSAVYLDRTYFFPESGGQPDDRGTLGGRTVLAVSEDARGVRHLVAGTLAVGATVEGHVDRRRRFDHMQQHSGQHLLSRVFVEEMRAATVGFHLGEEECTIDLDTGDISDDDVERVERRVNELVFQNIPIRGSVYGREEYEAMREGGSASTPEGAGAGEAGRADAAGGPSIRSRLPGGVERVRVVEIEGIDRSTCCGTHCRSTGEIGIVKILGTERVRQGTRVRFLCGLRALGDYGEKHRLIRRIALEFSTDWRELGGTIARLLEDSKRMFKELENYGERLAEHLIGEITEPTGRVGAFTVVKRVITLPPGVNLRDIAAGAVEEEGMIVLLGVADARPLIAFACSTDVPVNAGELMKQCAPAMGARGGGGATFAQGGGGDPAKIQDALDEAERRIREILER